MKVYLIGAGPGDAGLLTLKGRDALASAGTVIYDALANEALLAHTHPDAERIYVGKVAGNHALPQEEINALLIRKAKEGGIVARLKGGDPYIFGRGGEEAEALRAAGVPFEEIPGISSTVAAPAYAGIPLTHRDYASSVTIITGHESPDKPGSVHNWQALASSASTLVFVMGMKNLPDIARNLIEAGMDAATPAALVYRGTTPYQRSLVAPLGQLPRAAADAGFSNPSVIVVGKVCALRETLGWFEQRPLYGKTVVVTRAREQASGLAARLEELGARVIQCPTIEIRPLDDYSSLDRALAAPGEYQWVIFTSVNGVKHFWRRLEQAGRDTRALGPCKVAAIGPATAEALRTRGIEPDLVPEKYMAEGVVADLLAQGPVSGMRILLPRAAKARDVLPDELRKAGATVDVIPVYETIPAADRKEEVLTGLRERSIDCVTFGSSSTVENFLSLFSAETLATSGARIAAIGPITAATLAKRGIPCHIQPDEYTIPALVAAVSAALKR